MFQRILLEDVLTDPQQLAILDVYHHFLPQNIHIFRDTGFASWICMQLLTIDGKIKIHAYSPHRAFDNSKFKGVDLDEIDAYYVDANPEDLTWKARYNIQYQKNGSFEQAPEHRDNDRQRQDEFTYALAYGLCLAMGQKADEFKTYIADGSTKQIRTVIVNLLCNGPIQPDQPNSIWGEQSEPSELNASR